MLFSCELNLILSVFNRYGHIHFANHDLASEFYYDMKKMTHGSGDLKLRIGPAKYFRSGIHVTYDEKKVIICELLLLLCDYCVLVNHIHILKIYTSGRCYSINRTEGFICCVRWGRVRICIYCLNEHYHTICRSWLIVLFVNVGSMSSLPTHLD